MIEQGEVLQSRYAIEKLIGEGGMGRVYCARQTMLGRRRVALKEINLEHVPEDERIEAVVEFLREAETLAHLSHPNLVSVNDCFEEQGQLYIVMEFVDGQTLEQILAENPRGVEVSRVLEWARQLCTVLTYLHTETPAVIFRDLKPANIMIDRHNYVRLIDFGIAQMVLDHVSSGEPVLQGTPGYAPIEQLLNLGVTLDARSDIYALGATMYHLLTGECPPDARVRLIDEELVPPDRLNPAVPAWLSTGVMKMMALRWDDRFEKAVQVRDWLDRQEALEKLAVRKPSVETLVATSSTPGVEAWWQDGSQRFPLTLNNLVNQKLTFTTATVRGRLPRELYFKLPHYPAVLRAGVKILRSTPEGGGQVSCDAQLLNAPLHLLRGVRDALFPLVRQKEAQRRRLERVSVSLDVFLQTPAGMGHAADLSIGGLRLYTNQPLPLGEQVSLSLLLGDVVLPDVDAVAEVRWCRGRWGGGYESGLQWCGLDARMLDALTLYLERARTHTVVSA